MLNKPIQNTATEHDMKPLSPVSCPHKPKTHLNVTLGYPFQSYK